jgi:hypothetical protein
MSNLKKYIKKGLWLIFSIRLMLLGFPMPNFANLEVAYNYIMLFSNDTQHKSQKKDTNKQNPQEDFDYELGMENEPSFEKKSEIIHNNSSQIFIINIASKEFIVFNTRKNIQFLPELSTPPPKVNNA